ncbi:MAG: carbon-nitrogen hydrolase family protein [Planctomycetota bacterium]|jgi:predicted amidohydrolase
MVSDCTRRDFIKTVGLTTASLVASAGLGASNKPSIAPKVETILHDMAFRDGPKDGWDWPEKLEPDFEQTNEGLLFRGAEKKYLSLLGRGVHTRNGDSIELHFSPPDKSTGRLQFGFMGGFEPATTKLYFDSSEISFSTSDWRLNQPVAKTPFQLTPRDTHVLLIEKTEGPGTLVKNANIKIYLDGQNLLSLNNQNILPEMGVKIVAEKANILIRRFVHKGAPSGIPEYLNLGGWQMLNRDNIEQNLDSICRGLTEAADKEIQLLVTPETSLTGLFPRKAVTQNPGPIADAEKKMRDFIRNLKNAPYLVVGLPVWKKSGNGHQVRYNVSRLYNPDGDIVATCPKIHSCESNFWHGYRLHEFDIHGVPTTMHICHDARYPELWTLPVMFGARLVLHPANGGNVSGTVDAFQSRAKGSTVTSHAFYINVNGGGGSYIAGPKKYNNLLAISPECSKDVSTYPNVGPPVEALIHSKIRVHDSFGYWPVRSFRASEEVAKSYLALYKAKGGKRSLDT